MVRKILWVMSLCIWAQIVFAAQNNIDGLRIWPSTDSTRVVFDMSGAPEFSYFTLKNPHRLVIDLPRTSDKAKLKTADKTGSLVKRVRYSTPKNKQSARIVIELNRAATPSIFAMAPTHPYGHRLVVDLKDSAPVTAKPQQNTVVMDESHSQRASFIGSFQFCFVGSSG